jgi:hypothetical protein
MKNTVGRNRLTERAVIVLNVSVTFRDKHFAYAWLQVFSAPSRVHACPRLVVDLVVNGSSLAHRAETLSRHTIHGVNPRAERVGAGRVEWLQLNHKVIRLA